MSKNRLLKESTIRRFQKLASIGTINEKYYARDDGEEAFPEEEELPAEGGEEFPAEDELALDEPIGGEEDLGGEDAADVEISSEELEGALPFLRKMVSAAEAEGGEVGDEMEPDLEEPMGDEGEELEAEGGEEFDIPSEGEDEELELAEVMRALDRANIQVVPSNKNKIIKEVARRVEARMRKQRKEKRILEEVTKRVAKRLLAYSRKR